MTIERIQPILQDINARIEGLDEILFLQKDGTVLAQFTVNAQEGISASLIAEFAELVDDVCQAVEQGKGKEALVKGKKRFLALFGANSSDLFLAILGRQTVNFGLLNSGCRIAIKKIEELYNE